MADKPHQVAPNDELSKLIVEELTSKGLIDENQKSEVDSLIKQGNMKQCHWELLSDTASNRVELETSDGQPDKQN